MTLPTLDQVRDDLFERALAEHGGHVVNAAKAIQVSYRTLYRWRGEKSSCQPVNGGA
jgi:transcriptional regulator with PAS, ATPase and Fis domain